MKRYLLYTILFTLLFAQIAESKEYNKMFLFEYKILRASEISKLFEEKGFVKREYRSHGSFHFTAFEGENTGIFAIFYGDVKEINIK